MKNINIIISGYCGKMGRRIAALAFKDEQLKIVGGLENKGHSLLDKDIGEIIGEEKVDVYLKDNLEEIVEACNVLVEFTSPQATLEHLEIAKRFKKAVVIGTTGWRDEQRKKIDDAGKDIPVFISPNMSQGVNLLFDLTEETARRLSKDYDVEITEFHHKFKKDAPSGTARKLAKIVAEARNKEIEEIGVYGRKGMTLRAKGEIGIHSLRGGDVVGEHKVIFVAEGERIELVHRAHSRDAFARGALAAVKFIAGKEKGIYHKISNV
ncbi:MAG: 4-hydroxy-tetrahydrodipicolinate reductase [Candidatus Omnitrophica bacterium 4484_213]|nr:MAG: 4-hydroxy-tetrahydrodipicolinate reductase [Candidatus Omnitrophica bacterium 4484_213]